MATISNEKELMARRMKKWTSWLADGPRYYKVSLDGMTIEFTLRLATFSSPRGQLLANRESTPGRPWRQPRRPKNEQNVEV